MSLRETGFSFELNWSKGNKGRILCGEPYDTKVNNTWETQEKRECNRKTGLAFTREPPSQAPLCPVRNGTFRQFRPWRKPILDSSDDEMGATL
jgi:hypothetical protein